MLRALAALVTPRAQLAPFVRALATLSANPPLARALPSRSTDDYFAAVHLISNVVRTDHYLERTLNRLRLPPLSPDLVYRVLRACASAPTPSRRFFSWARSRPSYRPTTLEFEALLQSHARARLWSSMWSIADQMRALGLPFSPSLFSSIILSYADHGLADLAVDVFNRTRHFNCPQTTAVYNALLTALCNVRNFHGAYALIRRMARKQVAPDRDTFSILVRAWCTAGKLREAQEFLEEMSQRGFSPPVRGRDLLVDGLINAGYLESAKEMVVKMTKEGFLPDVATFNSLVEALTKSEEVDFCIDLLHDASRLGLCPDISTYKVLIPAVSKAGRIEEAFRLLYSSMEDGHKPFPSLYAPIVKELCRAGRFGDAVSFFSDMKVRGHPPNRPVYTMLVKMCVRGGRFVEAANFLVEMTEMELMPRSQSFDMVVDGLKHCGKMDLARRMEQLEVSLRGN
ncbi:Tetratricopeptide-like helical domain-containing protein [Dioscorea alata]|uniref:Tetratricopeptide-like helical domain-containing protein n=1 Tax=Dioscorea alata TaxID=55571 RepID=A0ACB7WAX2_DIOAL|nr:Tetratricopeptide-like helical domain-containing protein [Dioscorea alata]